MENFTLIANSGIQYLPLKLDIDLNNGFKILFHEWFDDDNVQEDLEFAYCLPNCQKVYRWSDLRRRNFIDDAGSLICQEAEISADPNLRPLEGGAKLDNSPRFFYMKFSNKHFKQVLSKIYNQWIPVPFLELNPCREVVPGSYNWCRCKIAPTKISENNIQANILFAFDTRALYGIGSEDSIEECPVFETESELKKEFRFCNKHQLLLDFCSEGDSWVQSLLMKLVHGTMDLENVKEDENHNKYYFLASYILLMEYISAHVNLPTIILYRDRDVQKINTEMIIDIGNSRTAAILYEQDFTKVQPLRLQNFENPILEDGSLNRTQESFDMSVAFQKVDFGLKSSVSSRQFIWPSMVRLGVEAKHLTLQTVHISQGDEIYSTYSSPKRYLWDDKVRREEWRCVRQDKDGQNEAPIIEGVSNYFQDNGQLDKDGLGYGNHYSRRTLMTFAFMEILAQANVQINSYEYRSYLGKPSTPRYLDKIILTCPTGMSKNEQMAIHQCLKDALYVLQSFYKNNDESYTPRDIAIIPDLDDTKNRQWIFDEATCSHFVYLYSLFTHTYQNNSSEFFHLYGKTRKDENGQKTSSLRIGSLDIGAGTSDIMICQYNHDSNQPSRLKPIPIFWDSFDTAGDDMLKKLISHVLLQGEDGMLEQTMYKKGWTEAQFRTALFEFVGGNHRDKSFADRVVRRDFNLQVLVPIMYKYLQLHADGCGYAELKYDDLFCKEQPSSIVLNAFKNHFGIALSEIVWIYDRSILTNHIEFAVDELLQKIATIMYAYDCDIILLSGRPTSLEPVKDTFLKYFAVDPNRLICLNKHRIGKWYPFVNAFGYINNSKSVVPTGAMLGYLASAAGGFNGFSLDLSVLGEKLIPTTSFFLINNSLANRNKCFITPTCQVGTICENSFPIYIGSKQFDIPIYPIRPFYVLDFNEDRIIEKIKVKHSEEHLSQQDIQQYFNDYKTKILQYSPLKFTIERQDFAESPEKLVITSIENNNHDSLPVDDFLLSVQSLNDPDCYWLDSGTFEINIKG